MDIDGDGVSDGADLKERLEQLKTDINNGITDIKDDVADSINEVADTLDGPTGVTNVFKDILEAQLNPTQGNTNSGNGPRSIEDYNIRELAVLMMLIAAEEERQREDELAAADTSRNQVT